MSAGCPWCAMTFGGCQCEPCASCNGLTFRDEFSTVHVCSSSFGELTTQLAAMAPVVATHQAAGYGGYYPDEPRGVRTAVLLTPVTADARRPVVVHGMFTPSTRSLR